MRQESGGDYIIGKVSGCGVPVAGEANTYTTEGLSGACTVTANFLFDSGSPVIVGYGLKQLQFSWPNGNGGLPLAGSDGRGRVPQTRRQLNIDYGRKM